MSLQIICYYLLFSCVGCSLVLWIVKPNENKQTIGSLIFMLLLFPFMFILFFVVNMYKVFKKGKEKKNGMH